MMQVIPKWKVEVRFQFYEHDKVVLISDNHIENVLRTVALIQWSENALDSPKEITISRVGG